MVSLTKHIDWEKGEGVSLVLFKGDKIHLLTPLSAHILTLLSSQVDNKVLFYYIILL